jgi:hypothetical protein
MTSIQFNPTLFIWPSMWTRLEHAHCLETINNMWKRMCQHVEESGLWRIKRNRSAVSSKWNKCRIYVRDQLDRWNEPKEVLRVQTHASDDNGSAILEVGICHIEGRSSYFLPQKGTIIYFQWAKERECIDFNLNFLIDAFLTFLFMICCQQYISKVTNFCLLVKIGSAILNDQVGSHMLNHLIFMFWWRSTHFCVPHCKEETWLNRLVWNLSRVIFSIKSSYLVEMVNFDIIFMKANNTSKIPEGVYVKNSIY